MAEINDDFHGVFMEALNLNENFHNRLREEVDLRRLNNDVHLEYLRTIIGDNRPDGNNVIELDFQTIIDRIAFSELPATNRQIFLALQQYHNHFKNEPKPKLKLKLRIGGIERSFAIDDCHNIIGYENCINQIVINLNNVPCSYSWVFSQLDRLPDNLPANLTENERDLFKRKLLNKRAELILRELDIDVLRDPINTWEDNIFDHGIEIIDQEIQVFDDQQIRAALFFLICTQIAEAVPFIGENENRNRNSMSGRMELNNEIAEAALNFMIRENDGLNNQIKDFKWLIEKAYIPARLGGTSLSRKMIFEDLNDEQDAYDVVSFYLEP